MNSVFSLHALAAWKMLRQRKIRCCRAAEKPAIRAACSKDQRSNSRNAGQNALSLHVHQCPVQRTVQQTVAFGKVSTDAAKSATSPKSRKPIRCASARILPTYEFPNEGWMGQSFHHGPPYRCWQLSC